MPNAPDHIVVVVDENHAYDDVIGSSYAPFLNSLVDGGALYTSYQGITNPSTPNYMAMFSGSTWGVTDDNTYLLDHPTLAGQLKNAGMTFTGFKEPGTLHKHNPWESFVESKDLGKDISQFPTNFANLPTVSFVCPDNQHDMHDGTIQEGDAWLQQHLGAYAAWAQTHNSLLMFTFDEGAATGQNHIPMIVYGQGVRTGDFTQPGNHYSLLHTIETLLGLPALQNAAQASVLDFWSAGSNPGNPAPTDITVQGGAVQENAAAGTLVATLVGADTAGDTLTYGIQGAQGTFEVVGNQVRVAQGAAIDYEKTLSYNVTLTVTDSDGGRHSERLTIGVQDVAEGARPAIIGTTAAETLTGSTVHDEIWGRAGNDTLKGLEGADSLNGEAGNDSLDGGLGADALAGGAGGDTYVIDNLGDAITEAAGQGTDLVKTTLASYSLNTTANANVENLTYTGGGAITATGNALNNTFLSDNGDDTFDGQGGNDVFKAQFGADTLTGGAGADQFVYLAVGNSNTASGVDHIRDFTKGQDKIVVSNIDANTAVAGNDAFVLDMNGSFSAGEIRQRVDGSNLILEFNVNANSNVDMVITLEHMADAQGVVNLLGASDFVL